MKRLIGLRHVLKLVALSVLAACGGRAIEGVSTPTATSNPATAGQEPPMVSFFIAGRNRRCPDGWREATWARGRLLLATTEAKRVGTLVGAPYRPSRGLKHGHRFDVTYHATSATPNITKGPTPVPLAMTPGAGTAGMLAEVDGQMPTQQLLVCEQQTSDVDMVDSLPVDTVAYFNGRSCPARDDSEFEWNTYKPADGRFIVPQLLARTHGVTSGDAWLDDRARAHVHLESQSALVVPPLTGDGGECNTTLDPSCGPGPYLAHAGLNAKMATTGPADYPQRVGDQEFPYVALMACRRVGTGRMRRPKPPPPNFTFFRDAADCATEHRVPGSGGRYLVGLPEGGQANQTYGGDPLKSGEQRMHNHASVDVRLDLVTIGRGVWDGPKAYTAATATTVTGKAVPSPASFGLPYIQLSHCWPIAADASAAALDAQ